MTEPTTSTRVPAPTTGGPGPIDRILDHPLAFLVTTLILVTIFSATFLAHTDRVAPGDDPAFYTWRTEVLISEKPSALLEATGPRDVLAGGYRVSTPIIGGIIRRATGVDRLSTTMVLTVLIRVLLALLLAGFAYRHSATAGFYQRYPGPAEPGKQRDPLVFHGVAFAAASLMLTPPFFGYLDNLICLLFLSASLYFIEPLRTSWPARAGFAGLLVLAGLTHPTTLVFFCVVLGAASALRLVLRKFDFKSVIRDDGPLLVGAFVAVVVTYAIWKIGAWGPSVSLSEAAVAPPADVDFFKTRLGDWITQLRPLLNGPLFLVGLIGLLAAGRRAFDDVLSRAAILWLLPLAGVFGFLGGFAYPYYRFLNVTVAWVLLIGLGAAFLARMFVQWSRRTNLLPLLGVVAIIAVLATNFSSGLERWNDLSESWLTPQQVEDFRSLQVALDEHGDGRPVVFVIDTEATDEVRIYGFMKLAANVSRAGLPHGYLDRGYVYLGSAENFAAGEPSEGPNEDYVKISEETLEDATAGIAATGKEPIVVVAAEFNPTSLFEGPMVGGESGATWLLSDGVVQDVSSGEELVSGLDKDDPGVLHLGWVALMMLILLIPGFIWFKAILPQGGMAEGLGLVPALSLALLILSGFAVLTVSRAPLSSIYAWLSVLVATAVAMGLWWKRSPASGDTA